MPEWAPRAVTTHCGACPRGGSIEQPPLPVRGGRGSRTCMPTSGTRVWSRGSYPSARSNAYYLGTDAMILSCTQVGVVSFAAACEVDEDGVAIARTCFGPCASGGVG